MSKGPKRQPKSSRNQGNSQSKRVHETGRHSPNWVGHCQVCGTEVHTSPRGATVELCDTHIRSLAEELRNS